MTEMHPIRVPSAATLRRYGLTADEWRALLRRQGAVCPICRNRPPSGKFVVDHEHVPGWKRLSPEERKRYVRGLLDWTCNRYYLARGMSVERARNVAAYLAGYEASRTPSAAGDERETGGVAFVSAA